MTPLRGAENTRLQQHILAHRGITNSTELCPVNSALSVTKYYECRGV